MRLGLSSWTYPWSIGVGNYPLPERPMRWMDLLETTHRLGVDLLQIADNLPLDKLAGPELETLRRESAKLGVTLESGTRGVEPDWLLRYLDISCAAGAKLLRTLTNTAMSKPNIHQVAAWLEKVLPRFEQAGVVIALENNEAHLAVEYARLVEELSSQSLGICLDTANALGTPETTRVVVETLAPHAVCLHYKEFGIARLDHRMGFLVAGRPPGQGFVDASWVVEVVARRGRNANVILEQWPPYTGDIASTVQMEQDWARAGVGFLRGVLAAV